MPPGLPLPGPARDKYDQVVEALSQGFAPRQGRSGAHLHRDGINDRVKGRRGSRIAALTSGGAIPDNADYDVGPTRTLPLSAPSTRISPLKAWPATSSCWATLPGKSAGSKAVGSGRGRAGPATHHSFLVGRGPRPNLGAFRRDYPTAGSCGPAFGGPTPSGSLAYIRSRSRPRSRPAVGGLSG